MGPSQTSYSCHSDICLCNICPCNNFSDRFLDNKFFSTKILLDLKIIFMIIFFTTQEFSLDEKKFGGQSLFLPWIFCWSLNIWHKIYSDLTLFLNNFSFDREIIFLLLFEPDLFWTQYFSWNKDPTQLKSRVWLSQLSL